MGEDGNVVEWVTRNCNDVGVEAGLELADGVGPAQQLRTVDEAGAQGLRGAHAIFHHQYVLAGLRAMREGANVAADGEGNAGGHLFLELLGVEVEHLLVLLAVTGMAWVLGEGLHHSEGGHGVDLLVAHELHGGGQKKVGVVDAGDAGLGGIGCTWFPGAVDADDGAGTVGFGDGGGELGFVVLIGRGEGAFYKMVSAGLVDFGEVCAFLALFAHRGEDFVCGVSYVGVGEDMLGGVVTDGVFVAAEDVDGVAGDSHTRAGDEAVVDRVAHGDVGALGSFGTHVALGSEAGQDVGFGCCCGFKRALRDGLLDGLEVFGAGVQEEMDVRVDEAGHQRGVAEIDDRSAIGMRDVLAGFADVVADDENLAWGVDLAGGDVEDAGRVQNGRGGRGLLGRLLCSDKERKENRRRGKNKRSHLDCEDKA